MKESEEYYWVALFGLVSLVVCAVISWDFGAWFFIGWTAWAFWKARHESILEEIREIKERLDK